MIKRLLDILASGLGLVLLSPLFVFVALWIILDSPGPPLFSQTRVGKGRRLFKILKFRSMTADKFRETKAMTFKAPPVTPAGFWLRKWKLDELPQLWNVLKGDMSLVGPRPEVPRYVDMFKNDYAEILKVRPGLTDPASLKYRHEAEILASKADPEKAYETEILPDKIRMAREYLLGQSLAGDFRILGKTLSLLFSGEGR